MLDREQIEKSRGNKRTHGNFERVQGLAMGDPRPGH